MDETLKQFSYIYLCVCVPVYANSNAWTGVYAMAQRWRSEDNLMGTRSLHHRSQGLKCGCWACWQAPLIIEQSTFNKS